MQRESKRGLFFDNQMRLVGWTGEKSEPPEQSQLFAFSGISVCSGALFRYTDSRQVFSIIETFLTAARSSQKVYGLSINPEQWTDIGTPESLKALQQMLGE
jgi:NDP-sugar pyrophosphorylase family protein